MAASSGHDRTKLFEDDDDPLEKKLRETGCIDLHYKVQFCMADHQDWRKCQAEVKEFRECMSDYVKRKIEEKYKKESGTESK